MTELSIGKPVDSDCVSDCMPEATERDAPGMIRKITDSVRQFATLSEVLRVFGAAVMVASMSVFLLQGWTDGNDIQRYLKLLSQTGLLALAGLALTLLLKEYKGARMFFGLSLASVPANFTVLGALFVSLFNADAVAGALPSYAHWVMVDGFGIGMLTAGALAVLIPVTLLGFRIMARRSAGGLCLTFVALNALLLVPVRSGLLLAVVLLLAVSGAWLANRKFHRIDDTLSTAGGVFARLLLYVPALLVMIRSLSFYQADNVLYLAAAGSAYFLLRQLAEQLPGKGKIQLLVQISAIPFAYCTAFFAAILIEDVAVWEIVPATMALVLGLFMFDFRRFAGARLATAVEYCTAILIAGIILPGAIWCDSVLSSLIAVTIGAGLTGYGFACRSRFVTVAGGLTILVASAAGLQDLISALFQTSWIGLAVTGGSAIVFGSLLDRYGASWKLQASNWIKHKRNADDEFGAARSND